MSLLPPSCQLCGLRFVVRQVWVVKQLKTNKARLKAPSPSLLMTLNWEVRWMCEKWQQSCRDTWKGWKSGLARTVWSLVSKTRDKVQHLGQHNPRTIRGQATPVFGPALCNSRHRLERVQRRTTKMIKRLASPPCEERQPVGSLLLDKTEETLSEYSST